MEVLEQKKVIARKDHKCNYCHGKIVKGERYEYSTIVYDELYHWKAHLSCQALAVRLDMFKEAGYEGVSDEYFMESVREEYIWHWGKDRKELPPFMEMLDKVKSHYLK